MTCGDSNGGLLNEDSSNFVEYFCNENGRINLRISFADPRLEVLDEDVGNCVANFLRNKKRQNKFCLSLFL